jgi:hypothetical protein
MTYTFDRQGSSGSGTAFIFMLKKTLLLSILLFILNCTALFGYVPVSKEFGVSGYSVELDPYYSSVEFYTGLTKNPVTCLNREDEDEIYKYLFRRAFMPRFLLLEASCYPMPMAGVAVKKNFRNMYDRAKMSEDLNLIEVMCSGFQEPSALSFFLGNIVSFRPKGVERDIKGKAYMGYLASIGSYHIKDSELIEDKWFEIEWKIKGDRITRERIMKWSYRIGTKQHSHSDIKDVVYFSIFRDRIDFEEKSKSMLNNASFEYKAEIDYKKFRAVEHFFLVGKSFPMKNKKTAFQIKFGFSLQKKEKYTGELTRLEKDTLIIMIRPNIKF